MNDPVIKSHLRRLLGTYARNSDDVDELTSRCLLAAWRVSTRHGISHKTYGYLYRAMERACLDHVRSKTRRLKKGLQPLHELQDNPLLCVETRSFNFVECLEALNTYAKENLSDKERCVLQGLLHEKTTTEIAKTYGINRTLVHTIRQKIRKELQEDILQFLRR